MTMLNLAMITLPRSCLSLRSSFLELPTRSTDAREDAAQRMESSVEQSPDRSIALKITIMKPGKRLETVIGPIIWLLLIAQSPETLLSAATKPRRERVSGTITNSSPPQQERFDYGSI